MMRRMRRMERRRVGTGEVEPLEGEGGNQDKDDVDDKREEESDLDVRPERLQGRGFHHQEVELPEKA